MLSRWRTVLAAGVLVALLVPIPVSADARDAERTEMVRRQRQLVDELDELAATDDELADALGALEAWIVIQSAEVDRTQAVLAEATLAAQRAVALEAAKQAEVLELEGLMAIMAVNAYVKPPSADHFAALQSTSAPGDAARMNVYLDAQARRDTNLVHRLRRTREQLATLRDRAHDTESQAKDALDDAAATLADLDSTRTRFLTIQSEVRVRHSGATYESNLIMLDLVRSNGRVVDDASQRRTTTGIPLVMVRGFRVHSSIAGQVELMLAHAEEDGIRLEGGAYRTNPEQIELRRLHCGDDHYGIYEMPAGECSPPTARPGNSMHELGLAIDFTHNGATIGSRHSAAFRWLADNAATYGFYNLPSEPWHWSVNGS